MPPTIVLTGGDDTLAPEGAELVAQLRNGGVHTEHHVFVGSDHDFVAGRDRAVIVETLDRLTDFFAAQLAHPEPSAGPGPEPVPDPDADADERSAR